MLAEFDLKELCERGEVTPRTVHFYVQQGLLPPAGSPGPGAKYGEGHLARLRLIRLLQKEHLPLAEIAKRIRKLTDAQVQALVDATRTRQEAPRGSALDYIRGVLGQDRPEKAPSAAQLRSPVSLRSSASAFEAEAAVPGHDMLPSERSQWDRLTLADGVELHVRRPQSRLQQRQITRLLDAVREIFRPQREE